MMNRICFTATLAGLIVALSATGFGRDPIDFDRHIRPLFQRHCSDCHGAEERNGGLRLDVRATLLAEADSGSPAIVPGEPSKSELIRRLRSADEGERMPPEDDPLADQEIALLERWIAEGAIWSETATTGDDEIGKGHWSFQPISDPQPPRVDDESWPRNMIDRFVQSRRESAGLEVVSDADPRTLIRRASYALTGLPPTPAEVRDFVAAVESPNGAKAAFAELVDRLLSRPTYGERWGRHWMDWVRYADTAGDNSDFPIPQAYLYRNYIIEAFNADLPYDRFLTEQIAGDLLPAETQEQRNRQNIATGYVAMARRFGSLVLNQAKPDRKMN